MLRSFIIHFVKKKTISDEMNRDYIQYDNGQACCKQNILSN